MDWVAISAVSGAILAGSTISVFIFRHLHPRIVAARQFWQHLVGVPSNPVTGQQEIPGLFERLVNLEQRLEERLDQQDEALAKQDEVLGVIRHEVEFNNGSSVKDAVRRIETKLKDHLEGT